MRNNGIHWHQDMYCILCKIDNSCFLQSQLQLQSEIRPLHCYCVHAKIKQNEQCRYVCFVYYLVCINEQPTLCLSVSRRQQEENSIYSHQNSIYKHQNICRCINSLFKHRAVFVHQSTVTLYLISFDQHRDNKKKFQFKTIRIFVHTWVLCNRQSSPCALISCHTKFQLINHE